MKMVLESLASSNDEKVTHSVTQEADETGQINVVCVFHRNRG